MDKAEAFKIVYKELFQHPLFMGYFDAKNYGVMFMVGISTVMEWIATNAGKHEEFCDEFFRNYSECLEEVKK